MRSRGCQLPDAGDQSEGSTLGELLVAFQLPLEHRVLERRSENEHERRERCGEKARDGEEHDGRSERPKDPSAIARVSNVSVRARLNHAMSAVPLDPCRTFEEGIGGHRPN